jgi:phospholipase C
MGIAGIVSRMLHEMRAVLGVALLLQMSAGAAAAAPAPNPRAAGLGAARTPIKHVIVIIGENRSFDHVFATYVPKRGETINNLLSQGIVTLDANKNAVPGPNFNKAHQLAASDLGLRDAFLLNPPKQQFPKRSAARAARWGPKRRERLLLRQQSLRDDAGDFGARVCQADRKAALADMRYYDLISGGTLEEKNTPDRAHHNVNALPPDRFN